MRIGLRVVLVATCTGCPCGPGAAWLLGCPCWAGAAGYRGALAGLSGVPRCGALIALYRKVPLTYVYMYTYINNGNGNNNNIHIHKHMHLCMYVYMCVYVYIEWPKIMRSFQATMSYFGVSCRLALQIWSLMLSTIGFREGQSQLLESWV